MEEIVKEHGTSGDRISEKGRETCACEESKEAMFFLSSSVDDCLAATDLLVTDYGLLYRRTPGLQVVFFILCLYPCL